MVSINRISNVSFQGTSSEKLSKVNKEYEKTFYKPKKPVKDLSETNPITNMHVNGLSEDSICDIRILKYQAQQAKQRGEDALKRVERSLSSAKEIFCQCEDGQPLYDLTYGGNIITHGNTIKEYDKNGVKTKEITLSPDKTHFESIEEYSTGRTYRIERTSDGINVLTGYKLHPDGTETADKFFSYDNKKNLRGYAEKYQISGEGEDEETRAQKYFEFSESGKLRIAATGVKSSQNKTKMKECLVFYKYGTPKEYFKKVTINEHSSKSDQAVRFTDDEIEDPDFINVYIPASRLIYDTGSNNYYTDYRMNENCEIV